MRLSGVRTSLGSTHQSMRHAEHSGQRRNSSVAQAVLLSAWHVVQAFGILVGGAILIAWLVWSAAGLAWL
jgi:hypothetical protein